MTLNDKAELGKILLGTASIYNYQLNDIGIELYTNALEQYDLESIKMAINAHVRESQFFPRPADLIKLIEGGGVEDKAQLVWQSLIKCLEDHAYWGTVEFPVEIADAIDTVFGGWGKLSELTFEELKWRQKHFTDYARIVLRRGLSGEMKLLYGQHDLGNAKEGHKEKQPIAKFLSYCPPHLQIVGKQRKAIDAKVKELVENIG
jgi:hypothetical protein